MISKITINDPKDIAINWWATNKNLKDVKTITFGPDLNILWGVNGAGKSSLLKLIAKMFHAEQGRTSIITESSVSELFKLGKKSIPKGAEFIHDGQGVVFFDTGHKVGLYENGGGFDWDFGKEGIEAVMRRCSAGELTTHELISLVMKMKGVKEIKPIYKIKKKFVNSFWKSRIEQIEKFFTSSADFAEKSKPTLMFDEPDRSVDIPHQRDVWRAMSIIAKDFQVIVASHSPFAVNMPGAKYIEITDGYLDKCRQVIKELNKVANE